MIAVELDEGKTRQRIRALATAVGVSVYDVCVDEMRLNCINAISYTFPHKKADGVRAITSDVSLVIGDAGSIVQHWETNDGLIGVKYSDVVGGQVFFYHDQHFDITAGHAAGIVDSFRTRNRGRVDPRKRRSTTIGGKRVMPGAVATRSVFNEVIAKKKKRIGLKKAGWLAALFHFAQLSNGAMRAPSWVLRQSAPWGSYRDEMSKSGNGTLLAENDTPYMTPAEKLNIETIVHQISQKRITRRAQSKIDRLEQQFNAGARMAA